MEQDARAGMLAAFAADLAEGADEDVTIRLIVDRAVEVLDGVEHASLTVRAGQQFTTLAATSELASWADARQYELGEGPCVDSTLQGEWFRSGDVARDERWPRWGKDAAERGVGSLVSVRLLAKGEPFGALNLYAESVGEFADPDDVELAQLFTVHAASALAAARLVSKLETAMSSRHEIGLAQGILMGRYGISADVAFAALRRISRNNNRKVRDVAAEVIETRQLPGAGEDGPPD